MLPEKCKNLEKAMTTCTVFQRLAVSNFVCERFLRNSGTRISTPNTANKDLKLGPA